MKYLFKKIEQAHSAYFENILYIGNEVCKPRKSDVMEEFESLELSEICKVLGWKDEDKVHEMLSASIDSEDEGIASLLLQYDQSGFLAECHMPECSNFRFDENNKPSSWSVHGGICDVFWIYADTFDELVFKLEEETDRRFRESAKAAAEKVAG